jgi:hypothetical protein
MKNVKNVNINVKPVLMSKQIVLDATEASKEPYKHQNVAVRMDTIHQNLNSIAYSV